MAVLTLHPKFQGVADARHEQRETLGERLTLGTLRRLAARSSFSAAPVGPAFRLLSIARWCSGSDLAKNRATRWQLSRWTWCRRLNGRLVREGSAQAVALRLWETRSNCAGAGAGAVPSRLFGWAQRSQVRSPAAQPAPCDGYT